MLSMKSRNTIAVPPGATIKEILDIRGIKQKEFALRMQMSEKHISRLINGEVALTSNMARCLELVLGIEASFWINLEGIYRADLLKIEAENALAADILFAEAFPYEAMAAQSWVPVTDNAIEKVENLCRFFEVVSLPILQKEPLWPHIACKRLGLVQCSDIATIVWAQKARLVARERDLSTIDLKGLNKSIDALKNLLKGKFQSKKLDLETFLADFGIALVLLPTLGDEFIQGVTFKDGEHIVIAINKAITDKNEFSKAFLHEMAHVILGHIFKQEPLSLEDEDNADIWVSNF